MVTNVKVITVVVLSLCTSLSQAQLLLNPNVAANDLVSELLDKKSSDLIVKNAQYTGNAKSIAIFRADEPMGIGELQSGVLLSTGSVFDAKGPNSSTKSGIRTNAATDLDLQAIATGVVLDAAVLEFDLIGLRDSIEFSYVFASEEYPEYVDKGVNDIFAFFIQEIGGKGLRPHNMALLSDGRTRVNIDNINHRVNEHLFLRSDFPDAHSYDFWAQHKDMFRRAQFFEYDGFTVPLKAKFKLKEGKWYHLKLVIADVGDRFYDSAVLIKSSSLHAKGDRVEAADSIMQVLVEEEISNSYAIQFNDNHELSFSLQLLFPTNEYKIMPSSFQDLQELVQLMTVFPDLKLEIIGHTDNVGASEDNQVLSYNRAQSVHDHLVQKNIAEDRLTIKGKGEDSPIESNDTNEGRSLNRRVEFVMKY